MSGPSDPSVQSNHVMSDGDIELIAERVSVEFTRGNADMPMWSTRLVGSLVIRIKNDKRSSPLHGSPEAYWMERAQIAERDRDLIHEDYRRLFAQSEKQWGKRLKREAQVKELLAEVRKLNDLIAMYDRNFAEEVSPIGRAKP